MPNSNHQAPPLSPATEAGVTEGGSDAPIAADADSVETSTATRRANKAPQDTEAGCRARAAADFARAAGMDTANGRLRLEHSGASWASRADLIHRLDASFDARRATATALWDREDSIDRPGRLSHPASVAAAKPGVGEGA